jgi:hypothetical protein
MDGVRVRVKVSLKVINTNNVLVLERVKVRVSD